MEQEHKVQGAKVVAAQHVCYRGYSFQTKKEMFRSHHVFSLLLFPSCYSLVAECMKLWA